MISIGISLFPGPLDGLLLLVLMSYVIVIAGVIYDTTAGVSSNSLRGQLREACGGHS